MREIVFNRAELFFANVRRRPTKEESWGMSVTRTQKLGGSVQCYKLGFIIR